MSEKPILFSTPMVQAIIKSIKSMTRRTRGLDKVNANPDKWILRQITIDDPGGLMAWFEHIETHELIKAKCPYGQPGNTLWVRETWAHVYGYPYFQDNGTMRKEYIYKASPEGWEDGYNGRWKPSIHMPRKAARLFLTVKNIRVERLQDISEEDAIKEGIKEFKLTASNGVTLLYGLNAEQSVMNYTAKSAFEDLWDSINKVRGYGWDTNCWTWVVEFERKQGDK